jgi:hypothetical protein
VIRLSKNAQGSIRVTPTAAAGEGKKTDEGTMRPPTESDSVAAADPRETQSLTPATTEEASDIMIYDRTGF